MSDARFRESYDRHISTSRKYPHRHRPAFPPLPDLRFELTYLRSIQPYIHFRRHPSESTNKRDEDFLRQSGPLEVVEVVEIEWKQVLWTTVRDQIISPLIQGTLWALVSFYLSPFSARVGHGLVERLPSRSSLKRQEGRGAGMLRDWAKGLGLSSSAK